MQMYVKNYPVRRENRLLEEGKSIPMQKAYNPPTSRDIHHHPGVQFMGGTAIMEEGMYHVVKPSIKSIKENHWYSDRPCQRLV